MMTLLPLAPEGELVMRTIAMPKDTNANGDIFGGWLVSQMDLGAGIIAKQRANGRVTTVAINDVCFIAPVHIGDMVSTYAKLIKTGRTSMIIKVEAWSMPYANATLSKVTQGIFVFVAIDEQGKPHPIGATP